MSQLLDSEKAEEIYIESLFSGSADADWEMSIADSKKRILAVLRHSSYLRDVAASLVERGAHLTVYRHMFAPPISQDQFALVCSAYRKVWEKEGRRLPTSAACEVAEYVTRLLDPRLTGWLAEGRNPSVREIRILLATVAPMLSMQSVSTTRRNRLSAEQEGDVIQLLLEMGWKQISGGLVEQSSILPVEHFMHKTKFATKTRPQEVDIACGLGKSVVLAMECKVTNDRTNSVKRVNDILKKASAWQEHWGSFVETAALLQGVVAEKDVQRLVAANVHVFWSHDLASFRQWLSDASR